MAPFGELTQSASRLKGDPSVRVEVSVPDGVREPEDAPVRVDDVDELGVRRRQVPAVALIDVEWKGRIQPGYPRQHAGTKGFPCKAGHLRA